MSSKSKPRPRKLNEMIEIVEKLAKPFGLVRVDLYYEFQTDQYLVGEITHCHESANASFDSKQSEIKFAKLMFD